MSRRVYGESNMRRVMVTLAATALLGSGCSASDGDDGPPEPDAAATDSPDVDDDGDAEADPQDEPDADAQSDSDDAEVPADGIHVRLEAVATGFTLPNDLADIGDGRLLLSDQAGRLHLLTDEGLADTPVLDLTDRILQPEGSGGRLELGLSGFAVHPSFAENGRLYVLFTDPPPEDAERTARVDVLAEYTYDEGSGTVDPASERELLRIEQIARDHVGGHMAFGDDGMLYVGLGDAGVGADASDPDSLRGSVIRIDVDGGDPYAIPDDNPFVEGGGEPEVYAYGFRNPMRVAWLDGSGLLVADPKFTSKDQDVHLIAAGTDHGWPVLPRALSGNSCFPDGSTSPEPECVDGPDGQSWTPPVIEYGSDVGQIVSGVAQYDGAIEELAGKVLVADWRGAMLAAEPAGPDENWTTERVHATFPDGAVFAGEYLWSLDRDHDGEVYVFTARIGLPEGEGAVYRIVPAE